MSLAEGDVTSPRALTQLTRNVAGVVVTRQQLSSEHIDAFAETVRVIGRAGIGLDSIDLEAAARRGIGVVYQSDYATNEVATHTLAMLLALARHLTEADHAARTDWASWRSTLAQIRSLEESTIGVVGCGRIGLAVIERLRPLAGRIVVYDAVAKDFPDGVEVAAELDDLLSVSHAVTLHLPLTAETEGLIDERALHLMPPGALLVNVSRGGLIDDDAAARALAEGRLAGLAYDAFRVEPIPSKMALLSAPRTLFSPHMAWYSQSSALRLRERTFDGVLQYLSGDPVRAGQVVSA